MRILKYIIFCIILFGCEKNEVILPEEINENMLDINFKINGTGDIGYTDITYNVVDFIVGHDNNLLPWMKYTSVSEFCVADTVKLTAISNCYGISSINLKIYVNDIIVADSTFMNNGDICEGMIKYCHNKN